MKLMVGGCDIGKLGAIVLQRHENSIKKPVLFSFPLLKGKEIDLPSVSNFLYSYKEEISMFVVEDVHSIYGAGAKANFQFGRALGMIEGILSSYSIPFVKISPKQWQEFAFSGVRKILIKKKGKKDKIDTKAMALVAAKRLYPKLDLRKSERSVKADSGIVDALLMSHYCKYKYGK